MDKTFLINQLKIIQEHIIAFEKLPHVKEMNTQLVVCWNLIISKTIIRC